MVIFYCFYVVIIHMIYEILMIVHLFLSDHLLNLMFPESFIFVPILKILFLLHFLQLFLSFCHSFIHLIMLVLMIEFEFLQLFLSLLLFFTISKLFKIFIH
jgi:hypothetical protein